MFDTTLYCNFVFDTTLYCNFVFDQLSFTIGYVIIYVIICLEQGNPGGLPGLYSGSVAEFTKADTVIFRTDLYNVTTGHKVHPFKRTIKYDSKWLDSKF